MEHERAFLSLKAALISDPVLRGPMFDGQPFIVPSDGCKDGFGVVLSRRFDDTLPDGTKMMRVHPDVFTSKRSSPSEEKYKPYLLEFTGLKCVLDKFNSIIYGSPVKLETDCQALRDTLLNEKLNAMHVHWRDGVLTHHIIDVQHHPGASNGAANGLRRQSMAALKTDSNRHLSSVNPDWEATVGLTHNIFFTEGEDGEHEHKGSWMCRYLRLECVARNRHKWSIGDEVGPVTSSNRRETDEKTVNVMLAELDSESTLLREHFSEEPLFLQVIEMLWDLDKDKTVCKKRRARHRVLGYG